MKPYETSIAPDSLIGGEYFDVDYQDAFGIKLPGRYAVPPEELVKLFFYSIPGWAKVLLGIRESIAGLIGLKTAKGLDIEKQLKEFTGEPGQAIALFKVKQRSETEILTGEKDKHLDFSMSVIGRPDQNDFEIILATTVIFKGWLGRLYFLPVKPIHRILVPAMLRRMANKLLKEKQ